MRKSKIIAATVTHLHNVQKNLFTYPRPSWLTGNCCWRTYPISFDYKDLQWGENAAFLLNMRNTLMCNITFTDEFNYGDLDADRIVNLLLHIWMHLLYCSVTYLTVRECSKQHDRVVRRYFLLKTITWWSRDRRSSIG